MMNSLQVTVDQLYQSRKIKAKEKTTKISRIHNRKLALFLIACKYISIIRSMSRCVWDKPKPETIQSMHTCNDNDTANMENYK